ncbi:MAG: hypothetical protein EOP53_05870 [Sphingobacteriales bacterium]|nr:MAG: hypothetical protein EOP53_05870 [Sphingobacteriales bacterium]
MNKILRLLPVFFLLFSGAKLSAQKPEKIVSFAKVPKTSEYYEEQADLWQKEVKKNKKNAEAWRNYYFAKRFNFIHNGHKNPLAEKNTLDSIVTQMEKNIPNSFEYNYVKYRQSGLDLSYLPYLEKAYKIDPNRTETYSDLVVCYEASRRLPEKEKFVKLMYERTDPSPGLLNYNYNVMSGLEENTILITAGDNDSYPVWMLQSTGFRKDITVLNNSLLIIESYRNKVFEELGVDTTGLKLGDIWPNDLIKFQNEIIKRISANSKKYPVAVALTAGSDFPKELKDHLYITGLAMKYSNERIDNIALLKKNFEQNYALDYLKVDFVHNDVSKEVVKRTNANYIVPVINLYEHYKLSGETVKANQYKMLAQQVASGTQQEEEVKKYFSEN